MFTSRYLFPRLLSLHIVTVLCCVQLLICSRRQWISPPPSCHLFKRRSSQCSPSFCRLLGMWSRKCVLQFYTHCSQDHPLRSVQKVQPVGTSISVSLDTSTVGKPIWLIITLNTLSESIVRTLDMRIFDHQGYDTQFVWIIIWCAKRTIWFLISVVCGDSGQARYDTCKIID